MGVQCAGKRNRLETEHEKLAAFRPAFLRNVCIALGNTGTPEDFPALQSAAQSPEELIAEPAHWAIQEIQLRHSPTGSGTLPNGVNF